MNRLRVSRRLAESDLADGLPVPSTIVGGLELRARETPIAGAPEALETLLSRSPGEDASNEEFAWVALVPHWSRTRPQNVEQRRERASTRNRCSGAMFGHFRRSGNRPDHP